MGSVRTSAAQHMLGTDKATGSAGVTVFGIGIGSVADMPSAVTLRKGSGALEFDKALSSSNKKEKEKELDLELEEKE